MASFLSQKHIVTYIVPALLTIRQYSPYTQYNKIQYNFLIYYLHYLPCGSYITRIRVRYTENNAITYTTVSSYLSTYFLITLTYKYGVAN